MKVAFTPDNAAEFARRSWAARRQRAAEAKLNPPPAAIVLPPSDEDARRKTTLRQIDKLDVMIDAALDESDSDAFLSLSGAKERLWKLVQPTAGVLRPNKQSRRNQAEPMPIQTPQAEPSIQAAPARDMSQEM